MESTNSPSSFDHPRKLARADMTTSTTATTPTAVVGFFSAAAFPPPPAVFSTVSVSADYVAAVRLQEDLTAFVDAAMRDFLHRNAALLNDVDAPGVPPGAKWYDFVCRQKRFVDDAVSMYMADAMPSFVNNPHLVVLATTFASKVHSQKKIEITSLCNTVGPPSSPLAHICCPRRTSTTCGPSLTCSA